MPHRSELIIWAGSPLRAGLSNLLPGRLDTPHSAAICGRDSADNLPGLMEAHSHAGSVQALAEVLHLSTMPHAGFWHLLATWDEPQPDWAHLRQWLDLSPVRPGALHWDHLQDGLSQRAGWWLL